MKTGKYNGFIILILEIYDVRFSSRSVAAAGVSRDEAFALAVNRAADQVGRAHVVALAVTLTRPAQSRGGASWNGIEFGLGPQRSYGLEGASSSWLPERIRNQTDPGR